MSDNWQLEPCAATASVNVGRLPANAKHEPDAHVCFTSLDRTLAALAADISLAESTRAV